MTDPAPLKLGWRRVKFGDVVRLSKSRSQNPLEDGYDRYVGLEHLEPGDLRVRSWGNVADGTTFTSVFQPGQVLFGKRRAYQRKVAVADFAGVCSGDIYVLESKDPKELLPELLPFICQTDAFFEHAVGTSAGSLSPRTNWGSLASFEFVLPSVAQQVLSLEVLTLAQDYLESCRELFDSTVNLNRSALAGLLSQDNIVSGRVGVDAIKLPKGWNLVLAKTLVSAPITKGATPTDSITSVNTGIPFIKVYNLTFDGTLDFSIEPTYIQSNSHEAELLRSKVISGDILMNIVGPPLGKVAVVPEDFPESNINQAISRFRIEDMTMRRFFVSYLLSDWAQIWLESRSKKTSGQRNLTLELCQTLPVPIPPREELEYLSATFDELAHARRSAESRYKGGLSTYSRILSQVLSHV